MAKKKSDAYAYDLDAFKKSIPEKAKAVYLLDESDESAPKVVRGTLEELIEMLLKKNARFFPVGSEKIEVMKKAFRSEFYYKEGTIFYGEEHLRLLAPLK